MIRCIRPFREVACFDPISGTLAAIGSAVASAAPYAAAAGAGLSALSTIQSGRQQAQAGVAANQAARYNAQVDAVNAGNAVQQGAAQADAINLDRRERMASATAAAGAQGGIINQGSPLEVLAGLAGKAKLDEETTRWNAWEQSQGSARRIPADLFQGQTALAAGKAAQNSSYLKAGSTLLSSAAGLSKALT